MSLQRRDSFCLSGEGSRGGEVIYLGVEGFATDHALKNDVLPFSAEKATSALWKTRVWVPLGWLFSVWAVSHLW